MIDDLPLRWILTGLFLLTGAGFAISINRRSWTSILSHGLHVVMSIAMAVMVWPQDLQLPTSFPELFFLAGALWFVMTAVLAARAVAQRLVRAYNALTMVAMVWMYAVSGPLFPAQLNAEHPHHHHVPDMAMAGDPPEWIDTGNGIWTGIFTIATAVWAYQFLAKPRRTRAWRKRVGSAVQATMAAGMAVVFASTLFEV
ncbi:hypothetical protein BST27_01700 [Mycobacterium intermedium]|uniref:DUF5134 domain-containing protein n=1 Tax=Mycobacterium intermedium TaxID=28445 RepID=A0A1E3SKK2_MYCIE|nr:DUF5134 domain-containing protein [Mycobacterium intermedium]MCV6962939.1 DUF5134 domain-containing protein [Mycobacterium intermedium]ODR02649.1 hypothetical protein BHQ20_03850 [Mycobacterium intermedium]OPE51961.1 hypothetical protein BV508_04470 [Mycobacterium intermedium]ORB10319.1 hypothetical protein BST27_01700 [Mycobacterium intermedium]